MSKLGILEKIQEEINDGATALYGPPGAPVDDQWGFRSAYLAGSRKLLEILADLDKGSKFDLFMALDKKERKKK